MKNLYIPMRVQSWDSVNASCFGITMPIIERTFGSYGFALVFDSLDDLEKEYGPNCPHITVMIDGD